jgi:hypothetical protein
MSDNLRSKMPKGSSERKALLTVLAIKGLVSTLLKRIKSEAKAAGHDVRSVRKGTGSERGQVVVQLGQDRKLPEMKKLTRWLQQNHPDIDFVGDTAII